MGTVISKGAAAEDVFADVGTTCTKAAARGGKWKQLADERLGHIVSLVALVNGKLAAAQEQLQPLQAKLDAEDEVADKLVGKASDDVWNAIGRPGFDPTYDVVFPGGIAYYTEGPDDEQPVRMELLAELLEMRIIAKLDAQSASAMAAAVRAEADVYRKLVAQMQLPIGRVRLLDRVRTALGKCAQMELSHLKRLYKTSGFSEAEIHGVIPDRPRPRKAPAQPPATPPQPEPPPR
jgi:hypothetical protein